MAENWKDDIIQTKLGGKKEWTDRERMELCHQLDKDLNKHINELEKKSHSIDDQWTEENWKEKMSEHPIFFPYLQENEGQTEIMPLGNDLSEGLAQLKFDPDHNSPIEIAKNYLEEGEVHLKFKNYKLAVISFTEGIKQNFEDDVLKAKLYNKRALAHYNLCNYRSSINDSKKVVSFNQDNIEAIHNAISCTKALEKWTEMLNWCNSGLQFESSSYEHFLKFRNDANKEIKKMELKLRKQKLDEKIKLKEKEKLLYEIKLRNIKIKSKENKNEISETISQIDDLIPDHPVAKDFPVYIGEDRCLVWPVLLLYPEYNESDCILQFHENTCFIDQLQLIFGSDIPPAPWDIYHKYTIDSILLLFEDYLDNKFINIDFSCTLKEILSNKRYILLNGMPRFMVVAKNSDIVKTLLK